MTVARTLNFHGIGRPGRALEPGEAPYWIGRADFEALVPELAAWSRGRPILITFDDGNASDLEIAAPLLARHGLQAQFFALAGRLGTPGSLDAEGVRELARMGFGIGSHGADHVDWRRLDAAGRARELVWAKETLEEALGAPVEEAAIPFGAYDRGVLRALRGAGYRAAWTSDGGDMKTEAFLRPRRSIREGMGIAEVRAILTAPEPALRRLRRRAAMLRKRLL